MKQKLYLLIIIFLFSGCSDGSLNVFSIDKDISIGKKFSSDIAADPEEFPLLKRQKYPEAYKHLQQITSSILASEHIVHKDDFEWEVNIIHNDTVLNAFCTPGGYIYVYTGLIKFLDSDDQLAGVLGHEIAHADLRHSTQQLTKTYGIQIVSRLIFGSNSIVGGIAGSLAGLKFSRSDETDADIHSVIYLNDTEYDPRGVARFFEKIQSKEESPGALVFLSTHPNPENRIENINEEWKSLGSHKGKTFRKEYEDFKNSLPQK